MGERITYFKVALDGIDAMSATTSRTYPRHTHDQCRRVCLPPQSVEVTTMYTVRPCRKNERPVISEIINAAAEAYRGVIPTDRWHDPYMSLPELDSEISAGVVFWTYESEGEVIAVMGIQPVRDVELIRHAYVRKTALLKTYWMIPERQIETSVVLANPALAL